MCVRASSHTEAQALALRIAYQGIFKGTAIGTYNHHACMNECMHTYMHSLMHLFRQNLLLSIFHEFEFALVVRAALREFCTRKDKCHKREKLSQTVKKCHKREKMSKA